MKNITIKNEVAANILSNLNAFKNPKNSIRFAIGLKNLGDGLASQVRIVNGSQMGQFGFKSELPEGDFELVEGVPYMAFNLKADEFCNYLSALLEYNSDIMLSYDDTQVKMSVGEDVNIPLNTIPDESCEPLLMQDHQNGLVRMIVTGDNLQTIIRKGGFLSKPEADARKIVDRVALRVSEGKSYMYSSDTFTIAKAWCPAEVVSQDAQRALYYLRVKGSSLDKDSQKAMVEEMKKHQNNPDGMIDYAKSQGFNPSEDMWVAIPSQCVSTIQKVFAGAEKVYVVITPDNIHLNAGNVLTTFALAGEVSSVYSSTVDPWEKTMWDVRVVVDKEAVVRALNVLRLSGDKVPFHISINEAGVITSKEGNEIRTALVGSDGNLASVNNWFGTKRTTEALSKLSNGNLILRFATSKAENYPLSISNGSLDEDDVTSFIYIMPVKAPEENVSSGGEEKGTEEK